MEITRNTGKTEMGTSEYFDGTVYFDHVARPSGEARIASLVVRFTPGAHTIWHTHPLGQTLYVTEGVGLCERRGGPVETIRPGDRVFVEPGEEHWHGAAPDRFMTHIAMHEVDDDARSTFHGDRLTQEEYEAAASTYRADSA